MTDYIQAFLDSLNIAKRLREVEDRKLEIAQLEKRDPEARQQPQKATKQQDASKTPPEEAQKQDAPATDARKVSPYEPRMESAKLGRDMSILSLQTLVLTYVMLLIGILLCFFVAFQLVLQALIDFKWI